MATDFLIRQGVKMILIACNTASAYALDDLQASLGVPVLGAVEPGARAAMDATRSGRIGVIGTLGTVRSGAYPRAIERAANGRKITVSARACPFARAARRRGLDRRTRSPRRWRARYLTELAAESPDIDVLVLGCTHYPLLRATLERVARELFQPRRHCWSTRPTRWRWPRAPSSSGWVSRARTRRRACAASSPTRRRIDHIGSRFLGRHLGEVVHVDL